MLIIIIVYVDGPGYAMTCTAPGQNRHHDTWHFTDVSQCLLTNVLSPPGPSIVYAIKSTSLCDDVLTITGTFGRQPDHT